MFYLVSRQIIDKTCFEYLLFIQANDFLKIKKKDKLRVKIEKKERERDREKYY